MAVRGHFLIRLMGLTGLLLASVGLFLAIHVLPSDPLQIWVHLTSESVFRGIKILAVGLTVCGGLLALIALVVEIKVGLRAVAGQRGAFGSNVVIQILLAIILLAGLNAFSFKHYLRWDWTRDRQFTLSPELRNRLSELRDKTKIVVLERHVALGQLGDKPDNFDSAAERKVVEKVKDLVDQFQEMGPQFEVTVLDVQEEGYQDKLDELTRNDKNLRVAIDQAPDNTIFFSANGKVTRLGFHDIYQLDKQSSQEANDDRGNLVLLYQGRDPFARKVLNIDEKKPRIALAVIHEILSMEGSDELGMAGVKKTLMARGFDTQDVIMKKWSEFSGPEPAVLTYDESKLERLEEQLAGIDADIKNLEEGLKKSKELIKLLETASLEELNKKFADELKGRKLTERDRQVNLEDLRPRIALMEFLLSQQVVERKEVNNEKKGLSADTLAEQRRISDLRAKTNRLLADCDMLIVPRMTLFNVARGERIPNRVYQLEQSQVDAIHDFLKAGKPVLFCFGPTNEPAGQMDQFNIPNDKLEDDLAQLGIKLGKQTVLFNVESKSFAERRGNLLIMGANVEVPPVEFDWPAGADRPPGQTMANGSDKSNPIRESLRLTARSLGKNQTLDLRIRHPRPVYYVPPAGSTSAYDPIFMMTNAASWNDSQPFPTRERTPRYEPPKSDTLAGDSLDKMRLGPFPIGVAIETSLPTDWYSEKDAKPAKVRVAAIGQGGLFIGNSLSPAKEKVLLDVSNWLLGRDDLLTKGDDKWEYPRVALADTEQAMWQWGMRLGMPVLFAYLGLVVLLVRRLR
jgi:ABC-type uncharacterized transport system